MYLLCLFLLYFAPFLPYIFFKLNVNISEKTKQDDSSENQQKIEK